MYITEDNFRRDRNNFDALRMFAAFLVFLSHGYGVREMDIRSLHIQVFTGNQYSWGSWRLIIFFSLSGFLVCRSITRSSPRYYLWNRFLRICPALAVCSLLTILIPGCLFTTLPVKEFLLHPGTWYFLIQNSFPVQVVMRLPGVFNGQAVNPSLWTIPLELKFYGLLILFFLTHLPGKRIFIACCWVILVIINTFFKEDLVSVTGFSNLPVVLYYGMYFFGGVLFYLYRDRIPVNFSIWLLLLAMYILIWYFNLTYLLFPVVLFFIYTVISVGVSKIRIPFPRIDISYGFYLYAAPVQRSIQYAWGDSLNFWQFHLITLVLTAGLATASWFLVEKKALSLKKRRGVVPAKNLIAQPEDKANQHKQ